MEKRIGCLATMEGPSEVETAPSHAKNGSISGQRYLNAYPGSIECSGGVGKLKGESPRYISNNGKLATKLGVSVGCNNFGAVKSGSQLTSMEFSPTFGRLSPLTRSQVRDKQACPDNDLP